MSSEGKYLSSFRIVSWSLNMLRVSDVNALLFCLLAEPCRLLPMVVIQSGT